MNELDIWVMVQLVSVFFGIFVYTMEKYFKIKSISEQSSTFNSQSLDECRSIKLSPSLKKNWIWKSFLVILGWGQDF